MPGYVPLCASRQDLLPAACRSCAWWQTPMNGQRQTVDAAERRHRWMLTIESTWGSPGLLEERADTTRRLRAQSFGASGGSGGVGAVPEDLPVVASIHYAPAALVPRTISLPFGPPDEEAVLLFCLRSEGNQAQAQARRIVQKALGLMKDRGAQEVYAFAGHLGSPENQERCQFFSLDFLESNGFQQVTDNGDVFLMRADLRGLLSLLNQVESAVRRVLRNDPTPSPAAWTRRGTS